jgi:hypothetical protein
MGLCARRDVSVQRMKLELIIEAAEFASDCGIFSGLDRRRGRFKKRYSHWLYWPANCCAVRKGKINANSLEDYEGP